MPRKSRVGIDLDLDMELMNRDHEQLLALDLYYFMVVINLVMERNMV